MTTETQFILIPVRHWQLDPQNKAHVSKLVRMADARFSLAAKAWERGNNSGDSEFMERMNKRSDWLQCEAEAMLAPLGIKVDYPGLYPSFTVNGYAEHSTASAVLAALNLPRNFLTAA